MAGQPPEEGCRAAEPRDVARVATLMAQSIDQMRGQRGGEVLVRQRARTAPLEDEVTRLLDDTDRQVMVGTLDDAVIGFAVGRVERFRDGGLLGVIDDLYTDPGARELGVGEAMIDALIEWFTGRGCFGVDSIALPGDRATKNFFETAGLVARAIVVHRTLG